MFAYSEVEPGGALVAVVVLLVLALVTYAVGRIQSWLQGRRGDLPPAVPHP
jgi:hypothetical protein